MLCLVMIIYIIHEPYIVKNIYFKNISSHKITKLNDFAPVGLGSPLTVNRRQVYGNAKASLGRELPWDRARGQWDGGRLQA